MNKFYYFSKSKLEFVEIKNLPKKFALSVIISTFILLGVLIGGYSIVNSFSNSGSEIDNLRSENKELSKKYSEIVSLYKEISGDLDSLSKSNDDLRIAADLPPISAEEKILGTGGNAFDNLLSIVKGSSKINIDEIQSFINGVQKKIEFEKNNYLNISSKLKENKKFYAAMPAIKPTTGTLGLHGFGMRMHPILGINRMHEGVDILTNVGTPVKVTGSGNVDFVGYKGGLGLCIEIDHGFGYRTIYGHLSATEVSVGQKVSRGQIIAKTGNTGLSSGPHLHYEVQHNGIKQNPIDFIFDDLEAFDLTRKN
ncbi:MAG: peptidoglycan DD-metalloendopeptidase family protein [Ignavibacteriales bacterium]|nr:peptidoglycan DD-metalloendopeptidase family protein [Ignavibacteriales bacterium]